MKTRKQHLITILLTLFLGLCSIHASAQTVTFTVKSGNTTRGEVRYKIGSSGSLSGWADSHSVTAEVEAEVYVYAQSKTGVHYGFSYWDINLATPPIEGTNIFQGYKITVTSEFEGKEVVAQFNSWSCTDLQSATYTLATNESGNDFTVTSTTDPRFDDMVFSSIGRLELTGGKTATIVFNTTNFVWAMDRIRVADGFLTLKLGDSYTEGHSTIQRHARNTNQNIVLTDPPTSEPDATKCKLSIIGKPTAKFVIHGNCDMAIDETDPNNIHFSKTSGTESDHALMFIGGGTVSMDSVTFTHAWNKLNSSPAGILISKSGGSVTMPAKVTMKNSLIEWCYSTTYGAGITIYNETLPGSTLEMENCEVRYCNTDGTTDECGGVIRTNSGSVCALTLKNCELHHNYSIYGGGAIRWNSSTAPLQLIDCNLHDNWTGGSSAKWTGGSGGALLAESNVTVSGCTIQNNTATGKGGGICVGGGTLTLTGTNAIQNNHASTDGGGIYQNGTMNINSSSFIVSGNTSGAAKTLVNDNIYLPTGKTIKVGDLGTAAGLNIRVHTESDASKGDIAVLTADNVSYLASIYNSLKNGAARLLDDKHKHKVKYTPAKNTMDAMTLYFALPSYHSGYGPYSTAPANPITTTEGLYQFMCYVNGVNGYALPTANAEYSLGADINMSGINWIPIGEKVNAEAPTVAFTGTFNGNGHVISGLTIDGSGDYTNYGLFGQTSGATIQNVFMQNVDFTKSSEDGTLGSIVGLMEGGTLSQCGASGSLKATDDGCVAGGLVGSMTSGTVHSSYATAELTGYQMGGLVGSNAGTVANCYANTTATNGLVGTNAGTVENCYANGASGLYGSNTGTVGHCYYGPNSIVDQVGSNGTFNGVSPTIYTYGAAPDNQVNANAAVNTYLPSGSNKSLVQTLNNWVEAHPAYAQWGRPHTDVINGDYPVLKLSGAEAVASDGTNLYYGTANGMIAAHKGSSDAVYLYKSTSGVATNVGEGYSAPLYIDEDVAITQTGTISRATVGVTLKNTQDPSADSWDWHMFSSALNGVDLGVTYDNLTQMGYNVTPTTSDYTFNTNGYFPIINTADYGQIDYYSYNEPYYHWINLKRNHFSHWNQYTGQNIPYPDESTMTSGKGYLMALKQETLLQATGTLNNGEVSIAVTKLGEYRTGYNFLGNPYQSYLDFDAFAAYTDATHDNRDLWEKADEADEHGSVTKASYIILDKDGYHSYARGASENPFGANRYLHPHQGFMIIVKGDADEAAFDNSMRNTTATASFRDERINYPLVNLIVAGDNNEYDLTTVELGRPDKGGALKAYDMHKGKGCIYTHYEDEDWSIAFTQPGLSEVGIRFEADEAATFTMNWDMENGEFHYLHLIDNKTGTDIDCLAATEYRFTATPDDYKSRFRLVFGYTGIEEPETDEPAEVPTAFAFQMGNELVVNGEGQLEIVDMMGRTVRTAQLQGSQSTMPMPRVSAGVYVLRLTGRDGVRTQKIVVR